MKRSKHNVSIVTYRSGARLAGTTETTDAAMTDALARNTGTQLKPEWFEDVTVNRTAAERRAGSLTARRSVKKAYQAAWLVKAITCIDLTTLAGDDTPGRVRRLCAKRGVRCARTFWQAGACRCRHHHRRRLCLSDHGWPCGQGAGRQQHPRCIGRHRVSGRLMPLPLRLAEIRYAVEEGAHEIDIVITREHVLTQNWSALYDEIAAMREACGAAHLKAILATGDLSTLTNVYRASMVAMQAGSDFIKTSTGKEGVNATLPVSLTMVRALRDYREYSGQIVGFKPAGGLKTAKDALAWLTLMKEEAGNRWLEPDLFRIGASSLLGDIERQLEHYVTGRYSSANRHAVA